MLADSGHAHTKQACHGLLGAPDGFVFHHNLHSTFLFGQIIFLSFYFSDTISLVLLVIITHEIIILLSTK